MRIRKLSSYLPEESSIVHWSPIQRDLCLYISPTLAPFCREGLLCPTKTVHSVNCRVLLQWGRVLTCTQPIRLSSHVMGSSAVRKTSSTIFTFLPNLESLIHHQHCPMQPMFYAREICWFLKIAEISIDLLLPLILLILMLVKSFQRFVDFCDNLFDGHYGIYFKLKSLR